MNRKVYTMNTSNTSKRYYIFAPPKAVSGGPELAHQMCRELLLHNQQAWMFYVDNYPKNPVDTLPNERYIKYNTPHVIGIEEVEQEDSVIVVPETYSLWILAYQNCQKVLWWMSVDSFIHDTQRFGEDYFDAIKPEVALHLVQSHYAYQYLLNRGVSPNKILYVSDYIGENYGKFQLPATFRQNIALYNPKKGGDVIQPLISKTPWLKWIPLRNLSEEQMIAAMEAAKVYVDFGHHPGKDRIPREAASCGCCVITNREGSAAFYEDVPIPDLYKIENAADEYDNAALLLEDICMHWEEHHKQFEYYRKFISLERQKFSEDVQNFINTMNAIGAS